MTCSRYPFECASLVKGDEDACLVFHHALISGYVHLVSHCDHCCVSYYKIWRLDLGSWAVEQSYSRCWIYTKLSFNPGLMNYLFLTRLERAGRPGGGCA